MERRSRLYPYLLGVGLVLAIALTIGYLMDRSGKRPDPMIAMGEAVQCLKVAGRFGEEGYWVGDVAELFRLGAAPRELAEADVAPMNPLVAVPVPFQGYYVRVMESGPSLKADSDTPVSIQGKRRSRESAGFCLYPTPDARDQYTFIVSPLGLWRRKDGQKGVVLKWPTTQEKVQTWSIVD